MAPQYSGYPYYNYTSVVNPTYAPPQSVVQPQIRSGGIVTVASEEEARRYPVAPGYTVTMRDETKPYLYEKTMGYSQLDQPIFRKARLVFEDDTPQTQESAPTPVVPEAPPEPAPVYAELAQLESLKVSVSEELQKLRNMIDSIKNSQNNNNNKDKGNRNDSK